MSDFTITATLYDEGLARWDLNSIDDPRIVSDLVIAAVVRESQLRGVPVGQILIETMVSCPDLGAMVADVVEAENDDD